MNDEEIQDYIYGLYDFLTWIHRDRKRDYGRGGEIREVVTRKHREKIKDEINFWQKLLNK